MLRLSKVQVPAATAAAGKNDGLPSPTLEFVCHSNSKVINDWDIMFIIMCFSYIRYIMCIFCQKFYHFDSRNFPSISTWTKRFVAELTLPLGVLQRNRATFSFGCEDSETLHLLFNEMVMSLCCPGRSYQNTYWVAVHDFPPYLPSYKLVSHAHGIIMIKCRLIPSPFRFVVGWALWRNYNASTIIQIEDN